MREFDEPSGEGPALELAVEPAASRGKGSSRDSAPRSHGLAPPPHPPPAVTGLTAELAMTLRPLLAGGFVEVRQQREHLEAVVGWESRNRYDVRSSEGRDFLEITEEGEGFWHALSRNFNPFRRIGLECLTRGEVRVLRLERPFTFWLTHAEVFGWDGALLGTLVQRFAFGRVLELRSPEGTVLAELVGPLWRPWTFHIRQGTEELGSLRKQWGGVLREMMTDADTFTLTMAPALRSARTRQLLLAAAILVDLTWFERRGRGQGLLR
ncbi:MAG: phospholipid scramblase-related protein [Deltaproteobacteria bacterium]